METFKQLQLNGDIVKGLDDLGFISPSPIQAKTIPYIMESKNDLIALAQTGTGKTAAFSLPIINQLESDGKNPQAFIICPTRELCIQISEDIRNFTKYYKKFSTVAVYGGASIEIQIRSLKRGADIVVGTPGRVHDLIRRKVLKLQNIKWLVLDEADEMLDMGFKDDLDAILEETPGGRQTLLFSATMSKNVHAIAKKYMKEAEEISVGEKNSGADQVSHEYYVVGPRDRFEALKRILDNLPGVYGILFCRTKHETKEVADKLKESNYETEALNGDIAQNTRTAIMNRFKKKQIKLLVATDVAARGIDVNNLTHVINYKLPDQAESYTHRSGRTGRANNHGVSISIVTAGEVRKIKGMERMLGKAFECKKIPTVEDVRHKQVDNFFNEVEALDFDEDKAGEDWQDFLKKAKKTDKEELMKYIYNKNFSHLMNNPENTRDLNVRVKPVSSGRSEVGGDSFRINFGKNHGLDVKGFFGLLNSNKNLKGIDVGKIGLGPTFSIFSVESKRSSDILKYLHGTSFKGKKIIITKTDEAPPNYGGQKRSQSGGRSDGGRKNYRKKNRSLRSR